MIARRCMNDRWEWAEVLESNKDRSETGVSATMIELEDRAGLALHSRHVERPLNLLLFPALIAHLYRQTENHAARWRTQTSEREISIRWKSTPSWVMKSRPQNVLCSTDFATHSVRQKMISTNDWWERKLASHFEKVNRLRAAHLVEWWACSSFSFHWNMRILAAVELDMMRRKWVEKPDFHFRIRLKIRVHLVKPGSIRLIWKVVDVVVAAHRVHTQRMKL